MFVMSEGKAFAAPVDFAAEQQLCSAVARLCQPGLRAPTCRDIILTACRR